MKKSLDEGKHAAGCQCGFCRNKGNIANLRKRPGDKEKPDSKIQDKPVTEAKLAGDFCPECHSRNVWPHAVRPEQIRDFIRGLDVDYVTLDDPGVVPVFVCDDCRNVYYFKPISGPRESSEDRAQQILRRLLEDDIPGGKAPDNHRWSHLDQEQLAIGTRVEREHTDNPHVAEEIAADHLTENPDYYRILKKAGLADELTKPVAEDVTYGSNGNNGSNDDDDDDDDDDDASQTPPTSSEDDLKAVLGTLPQADAKSITVGEIMAVLPETVQDQVMDALNTIPDDIALAQQLKDILRPHTTVLEYIGLLPDYLAYVFVHLRHQMQQGGGS